MGTDGRALPAACADIVSNAGKNMSTYRTETLTQMDTSNNATVDAVMIGVFLFALPAHWI